MESTNKVDTKHFQFDSASMKTPTLSPIKKNVFKSSELNTLKERQSRESPIVKAYNSFEEFYQNIKPVQGQHKSIAKETVSKGKFEYLSSFESRNSEKALLSDVVNIQQLELINEMLSEVSIQKESELYQRALKCVYEKLFPVFHKRKMNSLRSGGVMKSQENLPELHSKQNNSFTTEDNKQ